MVLRLLVALLMAATSSTAIADPAAEVDYLRDIKPVLTARCYSCHGALKQEAKLRLDTVELMQAGSNAGPIIEPGSVDESYLLDVLTAEDGVRMPPEGEPLSDEQIEAIRSWIAAGAPAPETEQAQEDPMDHWAFQPPDRPEVPGVMEPGDETNPIDAFLAAEHERLGLTPVPEADPGVLLRRVSLDLIGLAPTRSELNDFLADPGPDSYVRAVDRLLESPHFGERWGRHWMDVWRYSDWDGFGTEVRESQPHIWRWRDWIVESLNDDVGYDKMILSMLAADEASPDDPGELRATGFLVRNWYKFNRNIWLDSTVEHTGKAFLGLTINCAKCHDHKYDPISQADYYHFRALFEAHEIATDRIPGQPDPEKDGLVRVFDAYDDRPTFLFERGEESMPIEDRPLGPAIPRMFGEGPEIAPVELPKTASYPGLRGHIRREALESARARVTAAQQALDGLTDEPSENDEAQAESPSPRRLAELSLRAALAEWEAVELRIAADDARFAEEPDDAEADRLTIRAGLAERRAAFARADHDRASAEATLAAAKLAVSEDAPKTTEAVTRAEKALAGATETATKAAEALNGPLPDSYEPLSPVRPSTSTGRRLALARWMIDRENPLTARVAVNHLWMRHFGEPLVESVFDFGINGKEPTHPELLDWLAVELIDSGWSLKHLHRLIVTSNAYRMRSWAEADHPNLEIDPENRDLWRMNPRRMESELVRDNVLRVAGSLDLTLGGPDLPAESSLDTPRRSLYFRHAKEKRSTFLKLFDSANVNSCYRRDVSVAPQQALALSNSPLTLAQSRLLAASLTEEVGTDAEEQFVAVAFAQVLGRAPGPEERAACLEYLSSQAGMLTSPEGLTPFESGPDATIPPSPEPDQRARENLIHVLMNHSDFLTIR